MRKNPNKRKPTTRRKKKRVVAVSGGFDPIHLGHLRLFRDARKLGDKLVVILNGDEWLRRKKGAYFMTANERAEILMEFECVDEVFISKSVRPDVCRALEKIKPAIFANGGDRKNEEDIPEAEVCEKLGIEMVFGIGGKKVRSSSIMLESYCETILRKS